MSRDFQDIFVLRRLRERSFRHLPRYFEELAGVLIAFSSQHDGQTMIASVADLRVQFNRSQQGQVGLLGQTLGTTAGKYVDDVVAVRAGELAHVFHQPQHFDVDLMEHLQSLTRILQRNIGRRRYDDGAGEWNCLHERDDYVPGTRRQIDQQKIKFAPLHLLQELADDLVQHGAAHDHRLIARGDKPNRNELDAMRHEGFNPVVFEHPRLLADAHHEWNVGAIDVSINEPDAKP